jgi:hypothetical protein
MADDEYKFSFKDYGAYGPLHLPKGKLPFHKLVLNGYMQASAADAADCASVYRNYGDYSEGNKTRKLGPPPDRKPKEAAQEGAPQKQEYTDRERKFIARLDVRAVGGWYTDTEHARLSLARSVLWEEVVNSIEVRHPDAKAVIKLTAETHDSEGSFMIWADDTREPGRKQPQNFRMPWVQHTWPGKEVAAMYFVCAWMAYLAHEATELVSFRKRPESMLWDHVVGVYPYPDRNRVINVHGTHFTSMHPDSSKHWGGMNAIMYGETDNAGATVLQQLLAPDVARERWDSGVKSHKHELDALVSLAYKPAVLSKEDNYKKLYGYRETF